jgi:hypothetical protein
MIDPSHMLRAVGIAYLNESYSPSQDRHSSMDMNPGHFGVDPVLTEKNPPMMHRH